MIVGITTNKGTKKMWEVSVIHEGRQGKDKFVYSRDEKAARWYANVVFKNMSRKFTEVYPYWEGGGSFFNGREMVVVRVSQIK